MNKTKGCLIANFATVPEMITVTEKVKPSGQSVIGRLIEVKYHEITPDGSMRHPRFARFRDLLEKGEKV